MPEQITQRYELTGWETVVIYSEQEMADVLDMTCAQLRRELAVGSVEVFESDHPFVAEQIAEAVKFANPRAKVVIEGLSCKVTVDPSMRFKFSHIEWF